MAPNKKKKKAAASNPSRGFATTSLPSKSKAVAVEDEPPAPAPAPAPEPEWQPPTAEEEEEKMLRRIIEAHGAKVSRESQRLVSRLETERRTSRSTGNCYPLKLDDVLGIDSARFSGNSEAAEAALGEKIVEMAKEEYAADLEKRVVAGEPDEKTLARAWTLHKTLMGLGFGAKRIEQAIKAILGRNGQTVKDIEEVLDGVLEWLAFFCEPEEMPRYLELQDTSRGAAKKSESVRELDIVMGKLILKGASPSSTPRSVTPIKGSRLGPEGQRYSSQSPQKRPPKTPELQPAPGLKKDISTLDLDELRTSRPPPPAPDLRPAPSLASGVSTFHLDGEPTPRPQAITPSLLPVGTTALTSEISNLELETKDVSDQGEDLICSSDGTGSDEENTPDDLIPKYIGLQTKLFKIHPSVASIVTGGKKARGGGKKPTRLPPKPPPKDLPSAKKSKVVVLQAKLLQLERDPLFDSYAADLRWRDVRRELEEESWALEKRKARNLPGPKDSVSNVAPEQIILKEEGEEDVGMMGMLFEGPPKEESVAAIGGSVVIRDFEESTQTIAFGTKVSKGKTGSNIPSLKKLVQDICKSHDTNSQVTFTPVPGTSVSYRFRLSIKWSKIPDDFEIPPESDLSQDEPPEVVITSPKNMTVFEMKHLAAATSAQAEGYIATFGLFRLFGKKERLYVRLPTIWRNVWEELANEDRSVNENKEKKVLGRLKEVLGSHENPTGSPQTAPRVSKPDVKSEEVNLDDASDGPARKKTYEMYFEGEAFREAWEKRRASPAFQQMEQQRQRLPMWAFREQILRVVETNPVVVLCGETGCGKSTQLPAFLLEHEMLSGRDCKIYCTQPRRISALSLARRVAEEMGEGKGNVGNLVGYSIRLESMMSEATKLVYATTGIVMRMLESSAELAGVTHLVLDEVHERSIESDFLLVVLKRLLVKRKDLKVILMSATVDAEKFSNYLGGAPVLQVPGRTFPVQDFYLEDAVEATGFIPEDDGRNYRGRANDLDDNDADVEEVLGDLDGNLRGYQPETRSALAKMDERRIPFDLVLKLLETVATNPQYTDFSKAILVFLPGLGEIRRLNDMILAHPLFGHPGKRRDGWLVYALHSSIASEDQEQAFLIPPPGMRKIVLATNIAETGITIPDITAVIDTGKHKEMRFDEKRLLSRLVETFVSRANAKQRRGRAGRVQPGICWHVFTRARYDRMPEQQTPEMLRLSLQDLVLRVKICGLGNAEEVLTSALDSPTPKNIRRAVDSLVEVKALTSSEELTALGRQLAKLPLDVYLGKLVLLGSIFSCLDAAVTIAALLSSKSPFVSPIGHTAEAEATRLSFKRGDSDLLTGYNAYLAWRRVCTTKSTPEMEFCRKAYLSARILSNIEELKMQLYASLVEARFLRLTEPERQALSRARYSTYSRRTFFALPEHTSINSSNDPLVSAIITAAFYPKILARSGKGWRNVLSSGKQVRVHHSSVNARLSGPSGSDWLAYYTLMQTRSGGYDAHETTCVPALVVALLCGDAEWRLWSGIIAIDGNRVRFATADWRVLMAIKALRSRSAEILERAWRAPGWEGDERLVRWLGMVQEVIGKVVAGKAGSGS